MDYKLQFCSLRQIGWVHWEKKNRKLFVKNQIFQCLLFYRNLVFSHHNWLLKNTCQKLL